MSGGFKRSSRFGVIGLLVVMAACATIALTLANGPDAEPKLALGIIFGILAVYLVLLFTLQRSDLERSAGESIRGTQRAVAEGAGIENPMTVSEPELWAALAVRPIDDEAIRARGEMWDVGRRSMNLGVLVTVLIFLAVPPIYLFDTLIPFFVGVPLIVVAALYGSVRAIGAGGEMDKGYERVGRAMAPLGLEVRERPTVSIEMREPVTPRMGPKVHGDLVLGGERHGRSVAVRLGGGRSEVTIGAPSSEFHAKARDGKVRPDRDTPAEIAAALDSVPASTRWKKVEASGGAEGIVISRRGGEQSDWMADLWLAERLAAAG